MVQAVNLVSQPLGKFYDALSDEQKARFNSLCRAGSGHRGKRTGSQRETPKADCDATAMAFPTDRIDQVVHPTDAQRAKLDALQSAAAKAWI